MVQRVVMKESWTPQGRYLSKQLNIIFNNFEFYFC